MDGNVEYFLFQGAIRITVLFFKSVYHMIQMIQSGSVSVHRCIFIKIYFKIFSIGKLTPVAIFKCFYSLNLKALKLTVKKYHFKILILCYYSKGKGWIFFENQKCSKNWIFYMNSFRPPWKKGQNEVCHSEILLKKSKLLVNLNHLER